MALVYPFAVHPDFVAGCDLYLIAGTGTMQRRVILVRVFVLGGQETYIRIGCSNDAKRILFEFFQSAATATGKKKHDGSLVGSARLMFGSGHGLGPYRSSAIVLDAPSIPLAADRGPTAGDIGG